MLQMRKMLIYSFIFFIILIIIPKKVFSVDNFISDSVLEEQLNSFGIKDFLKETQKYAPDFIKELDIKNLFNEALTGKINNKNILAKIFKMMGIQIVDNIKIIIQILAIVLVHSVLKSITEDLENSEVSKIVYYAQYILIVTIIMSNFSNIITNINETIQRLVGFSNVLVPLLVALMLYTGSITTSTLIEPILLFLIEFISNLIKNLILPVISIIIVLNVVSKISNRVQINKLSKFMKSSIVWVLGIILTLFVGVLSLEGTLTSSVDGITAKTTKAAVSTLIPVVRQSAGRYCRCSTWMWNNFKECNRNNRCNYYNWNLLNTNN